MSEVSLGFIANVAVIGVVSYIIIFKIVDRICKCVETISMSKLFMSGMNDANNVKNISNFVSLMDRFKKENEQNVR